MTHLGKITAMHVRLDRLFGPHVLDAPPAVPQRSQSEMSAVLVAALVSLLVIACFVVATTGTLVAP